MPFKALRFSDKLHLRDIHSDYVMSRQISYG